MKFIFIKTNVGEVAYEKARIIKWTYDPEINEMWITIRLTATVWDSFKHFVEPADYESFKNTMKEMKE